MDDAEIFMKSKLYKPAFGEHSVQRTSVNVLVSLNTALLDCFDAQPEVTSSSQIPRLTSEDKAILYGKSPFSEESHKVILEKDLL